MSQVDSNATSEDAVRHLFRYLTDAGHLKYNPLVRQFFRDPITGHFLSDEQETALKFVRDLVREAAEECRKADIIAQKHERAQRHAAIFSLNVLQCQPLPDVARALGISRRRCYRERSDFLRRIGTRIRDCCTLVGRVAVVDEFAFRMRNAKLRLEVDDVDDALREFGMLYQAATTAQQRLEGLFECAKILVARGDVEAATAALREALHIVSRSAFNVEIAEESCKRSPIQTPIG